jgi:hypothetical protein
MTNLRRRRRRAGEGERSDARDERLPDGREAWRRTRGRTAGGAGQEHVGVRDGAGSRASL